MSHVFISYARSDFVSAELVVARLAAKGITSWMDLSEIKGGQEWLKTIEAAIDAASAVLVILSPHSSASHYVTHELAYARGKGVRVIPLLFQRDDDCFPWLKQLHHLDFTGRHPWDDLFGLLKPTSVADEYFVPDVPDEFSHFVLGNIELPVMPLTGSPRTPFEMHEVAIEYKPIVYHHNPSYPRHLHASKHFLAQQYRERYKYGDQAFPHHAMVRIADWQQGGETETNQRGGLRLTFELTTFDTYLTTNRSLDCKVIPADTPDQGFATETIRQAFVKFPYTLKDSVLSNPLAVMVAVISSNARQTPHDQIIIQHRGNTVASYRNRYSVSAAGYVSMAHEDQSHKPNPFVTAVEEAKEEIADCLIALKPSDFRLVGLALSWVDMLPIAYGYCETALPAAELIGDFSRDGYEGAVSAIPFRPDAVLTHIADHKWTPDGAIAMCAALLAKFTREEVLAVANSVNPGPIRDYFE